jgi:hypothetical protein
MLSTGEADVAILDMLARIRAQQGAFLEAGSLWKRVKLLEPEHEAAAAGLARLRALQRRPLWLPPALVATVGVAVILCGVLVLTLQNRRQKAANLLLHEHLTRIVKNQEAKGQQRLRSILGEVDALKTAQARTDVSLAETAAIGAKLDELVTIQSTVGEQVAASQAQVKQSGIRQDTLAQSFGDQVTALHRSLDREKELVAELERHKAEADKLTSDYQTLASSNERLLAETELATKPPKVSITLPGVTSSVSGNAVMVAFDGGLFDHGAHFKEGAQTRLLAVATALNEASEPLQIHAVGFADNDWAIFSWPVGSESLLALERASAVVGFFRAHDLFKTQQLAATDDTTMKRSDRALPYIRPMSGTAVLRISRRHLR